MRGWASVWIWRFVRSRLRVPRWGKWVKSACWVCAQFEGSCVGGMDIESNFMLKDVRGAGLSSEAPDSEPQSSSKTLIRRSQLRSLFKRRIKSVSMTIVQILFRSSAGRESSLAGFDPS